jgi:hypothetical protein
MQPRPERETQQQVSEVGWSTEFMHMGLDCHCKISVGRVEEKGANNVAPCDKLLQSCNWYAAEALLSLQNLFFTYTVV